MTPSSTRIWLASVAIVIVVVNSIATMLHWYYFIWWFDMPMHFLGGVFTALIGMTFGFRFIGRTYHRGSHHALFSVILLVLVVGVGWELYEVLMQSISGTKLVTAVDSVSDIFFDLAGGLATLVLFAHGEESRV